MSDIVNLTVIKSLAGNKKVTPNKDGYYTVTLGAFNVRNSAGAIYLFDGVKEILTNKDGVFGKKLISGRLRSEADHPAREPNMTNEKFIIRNLEISMQHICAHIKEVNIKETKHSENIPGIGNIVLIKGLIKPTGIFGEGLKESLDNPSEDTCFSVRSFTVDKVRPDGNTIKRVKEIVTWDWVSAPGIKYASKLNAPSVEGMDVCKISTDELSNMNLPQVASVESDDIRDSITQIVDSTTDNSDILDSW